MKLPTRSTVNAEAAAPRVRLCAQPLFLRGFGGGSGDLGHPSEDGHMRSETP